ncbi:unnamed protein product, partial [Urochloa humidicola]
TAAAAARHRRRSPHPSAAAARHRRRRPPHPSAAAARHRRRRPPHPSAPSLAARRRLLTRCRCTPPPSAAPLHLLTRRTRHPPPHPRRPPSPAGAQWTRRSLGGRYLVPVDLTVGQFVYVVRKRINISAKKTIFIFVKNTLPPTGICQCPIVTVNSTRFPYYFIATSVSRMFLIDSNIEFRELQ